MSSMIEQITAAYVHDQARNFVAVKVGDLPLSYESMTPEWLTNVLCGAVPGAKVLQYKLGDPDNGSANRRIIKPEYNEAGKEARLPQSLFCKATHGLANRVTLGICGAARLETLFYKHLRHLLTIEAPVCYHAAYDDASCNSIIMLGDLSQTAREFCTHKTIMTRARAESQMRLLGELHGSGYGDADLRQAATPLDNWLDFFNRTKMFGLDAGASQGFIDAVDVIPATLYRRGAEIWPATQRATELAQARPLTLTHGDVHLKNWYVASNGEMGLTDWQCASHNHWGRDFAYTISTALTVEDRRAWEKELLALYLDTLAQHGGPDVPFAVAWDIYREQLFGALAWWTVTLSPPAAMPDMQPRDITLEFIRRISTAMDDLDSLGAVEAQSHVLA